MKWQNVPAQHTDAWAEIFGENLCVPDLIRPCPICGCADLHRYYDGGNGPITITLENTFKGYGDLWEWCSNCGHYLHFSCLVPLGWNTYLEFDASKLTPSPEALQQALDKKRASLQKKPEKMADFLQLISRPSAAYEEGLRFFRGKGMLNEALQQLARDLKAQGIDYAVIGATALNYHGYLRFTSDIDVLMTPDGLATFRAELIGRGYRPAFEGATKKFRITSHNVPLEIITTGEYPGDGKPKSVQFPDPSTAAESINGVQTVTLPKLIELKLASGITGLGRLKDLADVQEMIRARALPASFADTLDASVRAKFLELQNEIQQVNDAGGDPVG